MYDHNISLTSLIQLFNSSMIDDMLFGGKDTYLWKNTCMFFILPCNVSRITVVLWVETNDKRERPSRSIRKNRTI